jgi:hypothetical protein
MRNGGLAGGFPVALVTPSVKAASPRRAIQMQMPMLAIPFQYMCVDVISLYNI